MNCLFSVLLSLISDAGQTSGASAAVGEQEKLEKNALGCVERGWICVPLVVEAYGGWGITASAKEALSSILFLTFKKSQN